MTRKEFVITGNYVSTKQRALLLKRKRFSYDAGFFKLKVQADFVAVNENRGAQQELSVAIKVLKAIVPCHQARVRARNLGVRCKNGSSGLLESDKKSDS